MIAVYIVIIIFYAWLISLAYRSLQNSNNGSNASFKDVPRLSAKPYVRFDNLVLPSGGNTSHTEIDSIIVSQYGIFCIEEKSHHGSIYGYRSAKMWTQYLGGKPFGLYNPIHQNYKHVKAIESLIGSNLRAPVHSYILFKNAYKLKIDSNSVFSSSDDMWNRIEKHQTIRYSIEEYEIILRTLVYASSKRHELIGPHIQEVQKYLSDINVVK